MRDIFRRVILVLSPFLLFQLIFVVSFTINDSRRSLLSSQSALSVKSKGDTERTLYEILGASPKDSRAKIKKKYNELARELHPDAQIGQTSTDITQDLEFQDINDAWQILGNEKKRKRYDRKLKAEQFSEFARGVGTLLELGFRTAAPIVKKTANATITVVGAAVEESSKAMSIFELEKESRGLESRAAAETARAKRLVNKIKKLPNKRLAILQDSDSKLTSSEALKLEEGFGSDVLPVNAKDIKEFERIENEYLDQILKHRQFGKDARQAEKEVENAEKEEETALQKLEDAKRLVLEAKIKTDISRKAKVEAVRLEKSGAADMERTANTLKIINERVRSGLRKKEENSMKKEVESIKKQCERLEDLAKQLRQDSELLKKEAELRRREEAEARNKKEP